MFFEPLPSEEASVSAGSPSFPSWAAPPATEMGVLLPADQVVARSANVVVVLESIRAFSTGCMLDMEIVSRPRGLSGDGWWDLRTSVHRFGSYSGGPLPDQMLRLGVRFADGTKATTIEQPRWSVRSHDEQRPDGRVLSWTPRGSGIRGGGETASDHFGLWLWPLPPAEAFEFAVEWPLGGVGLTIVELDGAAMVNAAEGSVDFWPDSSSAAPTG